MCCLCNYIILQYWFDEVFLDKDYKPWAPSPVSSVLHCYQGTLKNPHVLKSLGHVVPSVVGWPCLHIGLTSLHLSPSTDCPRKITMTMTNIKRERNTKDCVQKTKENQNTYELCMYHQIISGKDFISTLIQGLKVLLFFIT